MLVAELVILESYFLMQPIDKCRILSIDPNAQMIELGKKKLRNYKTISWQIGSGEKLDVKSNTFDFYTISFGLRNTSDVEKTIKEAYRVLKKGGRFFV